MPARRKIQTVNATDARQQFSELTTRVYKERSRVIIEKSGIPVAALIPPQDLERLQRLEAEREREFAVLDEIGEAFADVPAAEIERQVARALARVRAPKAGGRPAASRARPTPRRRSVR
ncbi:MAG TPA: type II toxin-antitoxin system Phd/YefM family antitoxin [Dehalococcoidia bacterium]|jgi:prevent-host-death family protein|nr:type II toxin-antitoxin system Phd/YefM family antitoxin [Dehalococcoidia bacterium]